MMYLYYYPNKIFVERTSCFFFRGVVSKGRLKFLSFMLRTNTLPCCFFFRGVASKGRLKFFFFMFGQAEHVHMLCLVGSINYYC